jgi:carboxylesterase type B
MMLGPRRLFTRYLIPLSLLACQVEPSSCPSPAPTAPTATVRNGTLQGVRSAEYEQDFFLGIPYAQPPLGNLRFSAPRSLNSRWPGTKDAVEYSPECVGYGVGPSSLLYQWMINLLSNIQIKSDDTGYSSSEDCLTLNIVRPAGVKDNSDLPVAVWIHGYVTSICCIIYVC